MSLWDKEGRLRLPPPQNGPESPFLSEVLFAQEVESEWEPRLGLLEAESPFRRAFEQPSTRAGGREVEEQLPDLVGDLHDAVALEAGEVDGESLPGLGGDDYSKPWVEDDASEGGSPSSGKWTGSAEQKAFRQRVLDEQIKRSFRQYGKAKSDLAPSALYPVLDTGISLRRDAAEAASRLLEAARVALAEAKAKGHADALRTASLTANSGYRGSGRQERVWLGHFSAKKEGYYNRTQAARAAIPEGPHSAQAISYMLGAGKDQFDLPGKTAAPGYSRHQDGTAIDFGQVRTGRHTVDNSTEGTAPEKWRSTWFFTWLKEDAAKYGFAQVRERWQRGEPWHWNYTPPASQEAPAVELSEPQFSEEKNDAPPLEPHEELSDDESAIWNELQPNEEESVDLEQDLEGLFDSETLLTLEETTDAPGAETALSEEELEEAGERIAREWETPSSSVPDGEALDAEDRFDEESKVPPKPDPDLVRFAQRVLNAAEGNWLSVDGSLKESTIEALTSFRKTYKLGTDGKLDAKTLVALAQRAGNKLVPGAMVISGKLDDVTKRAMSTFRAKVGLSAKATVTQIYTALAEFLEKQIGVPTAVLFAQRVLNTAEDAHLAVTPSLDVDTLGALACFRWKYRVEGGSAVDTMTQVALAQRAMQIVVPGSVRVTGTLDDATKRAISAFKNALNLGTAAPVLDPGVCGKLAEVLESHVRKQGTPPLSTRIDWTKVDAKERILYVMERLVGIHEFPKEGAAAIVGNLWAESALVPNRIQNRDVTDPPMTALDFAGTKRAFSACQVKNRDLSEKRGPQLAGVGLVQWTYKSRRRGLFNHPAWKRAIGAEILYNMDAQIEYLAVELKTDPDYAKAKAAVLPGAGKRVDRDSATKEVMYHYELPGAISGKVQDEIKKRQGFAKMALEVYLAKK